MFAAFPDSKSTVVRRLPSSKYERIMKVLVDENTAAKYERIVRVPAYENMAMAAKYERISKVLAQKTERGQVRE